MSDSNTYSSDFNSTSSAEPRRLIIKKDKTNPRRLAYLALLLFATQPPLPLLVGGAVLALAGILFHAWAAGYLARAGYAERESKLTVRGPYRHNRNPYYLAHLVTDFGFFCMAGLPALFLIYFPVIFSVYRRWVLKEEPFLEEEFGGNYRQFKNEVPRWGLRLFPAPPMGPAQSFDWATFRLNREAHRALPHISFWAVLLVFAIKDNPIAVIDPLVLTTFFTAFTVRLVTVDICVEGEVKGVSIGWSLATAAVMLAGGLFIYHAPLWDTWPPTPALIFGGVGLSFGLLLTLSLLPLTILRPRLEMILHRAEYQWLIGGLGLGLLSGTLGGIWIGILVPTLLWMLKVAGIVSSYQLPKGVLMSLVGFLLFAVFAAVTVMPIELL